MLCFEGYLSVIIRDCRMSQRSSGHGLLLVTTAGCRPSVLQAALITGKHY